MLSLANTRENRQLAAEVKFLVPKSVAEEIKGWGRQHLDRDPNTTGPGDDTYRITSLYFDTDQFDVYRQNGSFGRSKFRIRRYGVAESCFLERKLKTNGIVTKRRSVVGVEAITRLQGDDPDRDWKGFWYHQRLLLRRFRPVCQISYLRTARVLHTEYGTIRMTLDEDIRANAVNAFGYVNPKHGVLLLTDKVIVELKYRVTMPFLFKRLVSKFKLSPIRVSKYKLAVQALGLYHPNGRNTFSPNPGFTPLCPTS